MGKDALGKLCEKYKLEYDKKCKSTSGQVTYNEKRKNHTNRTPWEGYVVKAVREFYSDLKNVKHDDSNLKAASYALLLLRPFLSYRFSLLNGFLLENVYFNYAEQ